MNRCLHCNKDFNNKYSLESHQKRAKYCLIIQGKIEKEKKDDSEIYMCGYCKKIVATKYILESHVHTCKKYKEDIQKNKDVEIVNYKKRIIEHEEQLQIQEDKYKEQLRIQEDKNKEQLQMQEDKYKEQLHTQEDKHKEQLQIQEDKYKEELILKNVHIKELQDKLERICIKAVEKPTKISNNTTTLTTNNNITMFNLNQEEIRERCRQLSPESCRTIKDIAEYTVANILTNDSGQLMYNCTDSSRYIFKFTDCNGLTVKDPNAIKLISQIKPVFNEKCISLKDELTYHKEDKERDLSRIRNFHTKELIRKELEEYSEYENKLVKLEYNINLIDKNKDFCKELSKITS